MPLQAILKKMIEKRTPIVVVADEYGGTSGIITDKDIYEELFGTVRDEIDEIAEDLVQKTGENTYIVPGKMTMYDFERFFQVSVPQFQDSEMVTLSGFMIDENKTLKLTKLSKLITLISKFSITATLLSTTLRLRSIHVTPKIPMMTVFFKNAC